MNWKQLNEACQLAFLEWVKQERKSNVISIQWKHQEDDYFNGSYANFNGETGLMTCFDDTDLRALPEYFDALGIIIQIEFCTSNKTFDCRTIDTKGKKRSFVGAEFPTRCKALEAGIIKAFEIREEQLKQL